MPTLTIQRNSGQALQLAAPAGSSLSALVTRAEPGFFLPCGGRHTCGRCIVWAKGGLSAPTGEETRLLAEKGGGASGAPAGFSPRLCCMCTLTGDAELILPQWEYAMAGIAMAGFRHSLLPCTGSLAAPLGIAADIGTTTITLLLYHLPENRLLATVHELNRQGKYGADVLSRISWANQNGAEEPGETLRSQLAAMARTALESAGMPPARLGRIVVTGNTTMLHFLTGLNPRGIGQAPFTPQSLFGENWPANQVFGSAFPQAALYLPPSIGAYVGADISCGLLSLPDLEEGGSALLVDVGTNGEMALCQGNRVLCCATAAGPAFEGAQISMGMAATEGAVYKVEGSGGALRLHTIGNKRPIGICGTGLISLVAFMLEQGILDGSGRILAKGHSYTHFVALREGFPAFRLGLGNVWLSQEDVRQVQLAKAAISAGICTLLQQGGINAENVESLYLAGGFGSTINVAEAVAIGLIPGQLAPRAAAVGNAALSGAVACLFSPGLREKAGEIAARAVELQLSLSPAFNQLYMDNMLFSEE